MVLAFWPAHENDPASFKLNKTVPKLYVFCSFSHTSYFQLEKLREMAILDLLSMLNHEINKESSMWVQGIHFIQHTKQKTLISKICFKLGFFWLVCWIEWILCTHMLYSFFISWLGIDGRSKTVISLRFWSWKYEVGLKLQKTYSLGTVLFDLKEAGPFSWTCQNTRTKSVIKPSF